MEIISVVAVVRYYQTNKTTIRCTISATPNGIVMQLVTNSGAPASGVLITGQAVAYCNNQKQVNQLQSSTTNSSRWAVMLDGFAGTYNIKFDYSGQSYSIAVPTQPTATTLAVYSISSWNLTTKFCYYGNLANC